MSETPRDKAASERRERLAEALRANLRRRKSQTRQRKDAPGSRDGAEPPAAGDAPASRQETPARADK